jgi:hypothetical protein
VRSGMISTNMSAVVPWLGGQCVIGARWDLGTLPRHGQLGHWLTWSRPRRRRPRPRRQRRLLPHPTTHSPHAARYTLHATRYTTRLLLLPSAAASAPRPSRLASPRSSPHPVPSRHPQRPGPATLLRPGCTRSVAVSSAVRRSEGCLFDERHGP